MVENLLRKFVGVFGFNPLAEDDWRVSRFHAACDKPEIHSWLFLKKSFVIYHNGEPFLILHL
jgi:hypothetical protein